MLAPFVAACVSAALSRSLLTPSVSLSLSAFWPRGWAGHVCVWAEKERDRERERERERDVNKQTDDDKGQICPDSYCTVTTVLFILFSRKSLPPLSLLLIDRERERASQDAVTHAVVTKTYSKARCRNGRLSEYCGVYEGTKKHSSLKKRKVRFEDLSFDQIYRSIYKYR